MINMQDFEQFIFDENDKASGIALAWVIGEDVVYDTVMQTYNAEFLFQADSVVDISDENQGHDGITVRFTKNGSVLQELETDEYFGSILLSSPKIINLSNHEYGAFVVAPNAKFIDNKFVVSLASNPRGLPSTHGMELENNPHPRNTHCQCGE